MATTCECEVWVLVDQDGDYRVGATADDAASEYDTGVGGDTTVVKRLVRVVLTIPLPAVAVLSGVVPAEGEGTLSVAS